MKERRRIDLKPRKERVILLGLITPGEVYDRDDPLGELEQLAATAGGEVVGKVTQRAPHFNASTYIGSGKADEVRSLVAQTDADTVICDHDLSPAQVRTLEKLLDVKVVDRSELILDIFAIHARTRQAKLQVELAQVEYMMPRLVGMWSHFERPEGAIGTRGPGEQQLETDRRLVRRRRDKLKHDLEVIQKRKEQQVASRRSYTVSLVGYTNAGKSTLLNALTGADVTVADQLFATLDTKSVRWEVRKNQYAVLSDTVGFIRRLPHHLIASFHATLEEATQADLLMHVADAGHPHVEEQIQSVHGVLDELDCADRPRLMLLNKADTVDDPARMTLLQSLYPESVVISAVTGDGLDELSDRVAEHMSSRFTEVRVTAPVGQGKLISFLHGNASVTDQAVNDGMIEIRAVIDRRLMGPLKRLAGPARVQG